MDGITGIGVITVGVILIIHRGTTTVALITGILGVHILITALGMVVVIMAAATGVVAGEAL